MARGTPGPEGSIHSGSSRGPGESGTVGQDQVRQRHYGRSGFEPDRGGCSQGVRSINPRTTQEAGSNLEGLSMSKVSRTASVTSARHRAPSSQDPPAVTARFGGTPAMDAVIGETVALFHRLRDASQQVHGQGELSSGRWGLLRDLDRLGPQTVPQMARSRPVSRQYIQTLVDGVVKQGLVELVENPAHKRSPLVELTAKGQA